MEKVKLLAVNIRQFDDGEGQEDDYSKYIVDGQLDVDSLINDFKDTVEPGAVDTGVEEEITTNDDEKHQEKHQEITENPEDIETPPDETVETETKVKQTPDQAFAELRRQKEQYEPLAKWVEDLARKQGFKDPSELIEAFNKQQLAKEAEERGVPLDIYERLYTLEQESKQKDEALFQTQFNAEVDATVKKYDLKNDQVNNVFQFMAQNGYVDESGKPKIAFEDAYVLANRDNLIAQAEERAKQQYLEEKQKKQQQATPDVGTNANDKPSNGSDLDNVDPLKWLENNGIEWR